VYQLGRGSEPVIVVGNTMSLVPRYIFCASADVSSGFAFFAGHSSGSSRAAKSRGRKDGRDRDEWPQPMSDGPPRPMSYAGALADGVMTNADNVVTKS
jgi:hypothetical protein